MNAPRVSCNIRDWVVLFEVLRSKDIFEVLLGGVGVKYPAACVFWRHRSTVLGTQDPAKVCLVLKRILIPIRAVMGEDAGIYLALGVFFGGNFYGTTVRYIVEGSS